MDSRGEVLLDGSERTPGRDAQAYGEELAEGRSVPGSGDLGAGRPELFVESRGKFVARPGDRSNPHTEPLETFGGDDVTTPEAPPAKVPVQPLGTRRACPRLRGDAAGDAGQLWGACRAATGRI